MLNGFITIPESAVPIRTADKQILQNLARRAVDRR